MKNRVQPRGVPIWGQIHGHGLTMTEAHQTSHPHRSSTQGKVYWESTPGTELSPGEQGIDSISLNPDTALKPTVKIFEVQKELAQKKSFTNTS
jgi:hypothetical protein